MKAIEIQNYGDSTTLQIVEIAKPTIGNHQVLIKIKASSINPVDIKIRMGYLAAMLPKTFPMVLGWEASGIIEAVGVQVQDLKIGDEVYTMPNFMQGGTYAEYVAVNGNEVALKPTTISFEKASTVPMVAGAAYTSLVSSTSFRWTKNFNSRCSWSRWYLCSSNG
jgi:NADPH:quinone reductase-like Zn-dependent oxidoreductase